MSFLFFGRCADTWIARLYELVEKQGAAVVNISTTQTARGQAQVMPFPFDEDDPAFEFFKRFIPRQPNGGAPRELRTSPWVLAS